MCGELRVSREDVRQFVLGAAVGGGGSSSGSGSAGGQPSSLTSESSASGDKTAGSKRKADELQIGSTQGCEDSGGGKAPTREKIVTTGWSALPPDLVRRIGKLQTDTQSLAGMERTCKSWRRVVMEGNDDPDITSKKPSLWRDMVLGWNPTIASVAEALIDSPTGTTSQGAGVSGFSWKGLLQAHWGASMRRGTPAPYQPHTQLTDYIFTVEFRSGDEFLFATSGRGLRTPKLWNQNVAFDAHRGVIEGDLDPEIGKRLGDDPFNADQLKNMTARVLVTKVSDMSIVELARVHIDAGNIWYSGIDGIGFEPRSNSPCLPKTRLVTAEKNVYYDGYNECALVRNHSLQLHLTLEPKTGEVSLGFVLVGQDIDFLSPLETLIYLEVQCPWPKRNNEKKCK